MSMLLFMIPALVIVTVVLCRDILCVYTYANTGNHKGTYVEIVLETECIHVHCIYPSLIYMNYFDKTTLVGVFLLPFLQFILKSDYCHKMLLNILCMCLCVWICVCVSGTSLVRPSLCMCVSMLRQHSRLAFRCVLWYGNSVTGVGELWRSGSCHDWEHGGGTAAAQAIQGHHT